MMLGSEQNVATDTDECRHLSSGKCGSGRVFTSRTWADLGKISISTKDTEPKSSTVESSVVAGQSSSPTVDELIERNVSLLESLILRVVAFRSRRSRHRWPGHSDVGLSWKGHAGSGRQAGGQGEVDVCASKCNDRFYGGTYCSNTKFDSIDGIRQKVLRTGPNSSLNCGPLNFSGPDKQALMNSKEHPRILSDKLETGTLISKRSSASARQLLNDEENEHSLRLHVEASTASLESARSTRGVRRAALDGTNDNYEERMKKFRFSSVPNEGCPNASEKAGVVSDESKEYQKNPSLDFRTKEQCHNVGREDEEAIRSTTNENAFSRSFPQKLMEVLSRKDTQSAIVWMPDGMSFIILSPRAFVAAVLPKFFKQTKFASFTRKLSRWGFKQITKGAYAGAYFHKLFQRDKPDLCLQMCSQKNGEVPEIARDEGGNPATMPDAAASQLRDFVSRIASLYNDVPYHNFEHASHVTLSANKLVLMLGERSWGLPGGGGGGTCGTSATALHFSTFGLSSDPMTHLALVFAALVHDVGHTGVGNGQLVTEQHPLAVRYGNKTVAERHSLHIAFSLLTEDRYKELRQCMFGHWDDPQLSKKEAREVRAEMKKFREVVMDVILCTDIASDDRRSKGQKRWREAFEDVSSCSVASECSPPTRPLHLEKAAGETPVPIPPLCPADPAGVGRARSKRKFSRRFTAPHCTYSDPAITSAECSSSTTVHVGSALLSNGYTQEYYPGSASPNNSYSDLNSLRAASVLEQMIQAADVAHTMQSWTTFVKWNRMLYEELYLAHSLGRGFDCSENWFGGQIGFFDGYVVPLAKRLQQCGVFGSEGCTFLESALENRRRWTAEGRELCEAMHSVAVKKFGHVGRDGGKEEGEELIANDSSSSSPACSGTNLNVRQ